MFGLFSRLVVGVGLLGASLFSVVASAQSLRFPASDSDYDYFYPTAYFDHSGVDWACGGTTYSGHRGSDFGVGGFDGMDAGRDVVAAAGGSVTYTNDGEYDRCTTGACSGGGGFGNYVKLQHADGTHTLYAHLKKYSLTVSKGDWVSCGEKIGEVGSSGYSTGPHLHFEVRDGSESAFDPFAGDCSVDESAWFEQGSYGELPAPVCAGEAEACEPIELLTCGDVIESSNTAPGSTDTHWYYGCSEWVYSGPEVAYTFQTDRDEPVTVSITGLTGDLDLYALESDACDGTGCLASSSQSNDADESVSFDAAAGQEVVIVIDGWEAAESNFTLTIDCEGQLPEGLDTADGMDSADTGAFSTDSGQEGRSPLSDDEGEGAGCGCSAGPSGPSGAALMLAVVGLGVGRRRRAPR